MNGSEALLVYFPMLNLPESSWLGRQLLYWDRLVIPTPIHLAERPEDNFDDFTRELMARGLVSYEFTENHFDAVLSVSGAFASAIERTDLDERRKGMTGVPTFGLHEGKTSIDLLDHLAHLGLAASEADGWWQVERTTAHEFMAAVSRAIASELHAGVVTDSDVAAAAVTGEIDLARLALLTEALPSPELLDLEVLEILRVHRDELAAFREETERYAFLVARSETRDEADEWRDQYRLRLEEAEAVLAKYLSAAARTGRLVKSPYAALLAGRLGALVGTLQSVAGIDPGAASPDPDFIYAARVRKRLGQEDTTPG